MKLEGSERTLSRWSPCYLVHQCPRSHEPCTERERVEWSTTFPLPYYVYPRHHRFNHLTVYSSPPVSSTRSDLFHPLSRVAFSPLFFYVPTLDVYTLEPRSPNEAQDALARSKMYPRYRSQRIHTVSERVRERERREFFSSPSTAVVVAASAVLSRSLDTPTQERIARAASLTHAASVSSSIRDRRVHKR